MKKFRVAVTCKLNGKYAESVISASSLSALFHALSIAPDFNDMCEVDITELD